MQSLVSCQELKPLERMVQIRVLKVSPQDTLPSQLWALGDLPTQGHWEPVYSTAEHRTGEYRMEAELHKKQTCPVSVSFPFPTPAEHDHKTPTRAHAF